MSIKQQSLPEYIKGLNIWNEVDVPNISNMKDQLLFKAYTTAITGKRESSHVRYILPSIKVEDKEVQNLVSLIKWSIDEIWDIETQKLIHEWLWIRLWYDENWNYWYQKVA